MLAALLKNKYPTAITGPGGTGDFHVRDDGDGKPYIARWDATNLGPAPTAAQIAAWMAEAPDDPIQSFTPAQIIAGLKAIDPAMASAIIEATDELTYAEFITATSVGEDDPRLAAALASQSLTVADLKAALKGVP
jgi:hypothetical protein